MAGLRPTTKAWAKGTNQILHGHKVGCPEKLPRGPAAVDEESVTGDERSGGRG